ncbi:hypothetical protein [Azotobacter vinelandii]|uniref:hypothetical protein n=1 Tax=Azotobacter vinelandii TaxID=354 RepID=UPI00091C1910|nr:hypothetical protein [Azotobacter vinelandii]WKN23211.1 hypothetical protein AVAEIV_001248 [Azotobacter vinelandii]SFY07866.1 hypothetical protein SAMN04244547_03885 [Azotobacter vinelandii]
MADPKTVTVSLQDLKEWRQAWLDENDPPDGTDCVTPFDHYLYGTGITAEHTLIRALASAPCGRDPIAGQALPWLLAMRTHRSDLYRRLGLSENAQFTLLVDMFMHIRNALAAQGIDREFLRRHLGEGSPDQEGHSHG